MFHVRRVALLLAFVSLLAAPAAALPLKESAPEAFPVLSFFQGLWERVTKPLVSQWEIRSVSSENRGVWDPNGEPVSTSSSSLPESPEGDSL